MNQAGVSEMLGNALALHRQGELADAARLYGEALAQEPECADALHLLGVLKGQMGDREAAVRLIGRAIAGSPRVSAYHNNLGNVLKASGEQERARESYERAVKLDRGNADAYLNLGRLMLERNDLRAARGNLHKALRIAPRMLEAHLSLGRVEEAAGDLAQAVAAFRNGVRIAPTHAPAWLMLARANSAAGKLTEAEVALRRALALDPAYADAHFNLGTTLLSARRPLEATEAFRRAIELAPATAYDAWNNLGLALSELGGTEEAIAAFESAIRLQPEYEGAYLNLAKEELKRNNEDAARALFERVVALRPRRMEVYLHLGALEERDGAAGLAKAVELYRRALALLGPTREIDSRLGLALARLGEREGIEILERLADERPDSAEAHFDLGTARLVWVQQQWEPEAEGARRALGRALELDPAHADALLNLGVLEERDGDLDAAERLYRRGRETGAASVDLMNNLGGVLTLKGDAEGIDILREIVREHPEYAEAHFSLGTALLLDGQYREGWREYEWRRRVERLRANCRVSTLPDWEGERLDGRGILLYSEQGFGDTLQFARYVPLVAAMGATVVLDVQPPLRRLLGGLGGVSVLLEEDARLPECAVCLPLMSLPRIFNTTLETIPEGRLPVLTRLAAPARRQGTLRVGLVWAGNPRHQRDRLRSIALEELKPLLELEEIDWVSLQTGPAAEQAVGYPFVEDCRAVRDFADTAAMVARLDLVIAIDSAVAHLAGAMGKPVWMLLAKTPDWRWGLGAERTPWYTSARLLRQRRAQDWSEVVDELRARLIRMVREARGGRASLPATSTSRPGESASL